MGRFRSHGFYTVEDGKGRGWRYARLVRWFHFGEPPTPRDEAPLVVEFGLEWAHFRAKHHDALRLKVSTTGEETLDVAYSLGKVLAHYWKVTVSRHPSGERSRWWRWGSLRLPPVRFDVAVNPTGVRWCLGPDPQSWERYASWPERLRRNDLTWWKVHRSRIASEEVAHAHRAIPMPEGEYPAVVTLHRERWALVVGPYSLTRTASRRFRWVCPWNVHTTWSADVSIPDGVPVPGNSESDFYDGQDRIYGTGCTITRTAAEYLPGERWAEEAVAAVVATVYRTRVRRGRGVTDTGARP